MLDLSSIATNRCLSYAVGVVSHINDISLPDKRLAPRVLLRQDSFMALNQGRFSVFRVGRCRRQSAEKIVLEDCDLHFTLLADVRPRLTFRPKLSDFNRHFGRGTPVVLPSQGDLIIVVHNSRLEAWPVFVITSNQHAWNRSVLMLDTRFVSQRYDTSTFDRFVASFENQQSPDEQEQFLNYYQDQPAEIQESLMRVSFDRIANNEFSVLVCDQPVLFYCEGQFVLRIFL